MKQQLSSFWIGDNFLPITKDKKKDIFQLAKYKRSVGNFVRIMTGKSIPVKFLTRNSYTDNKVVYIGSNLSDKNFDSAVGLALHESSHILFSDFSLIRNLLDYIPQDVINKFNDLGISKHETKGKIKRILNVIEDRRIDAITFKSAVGYRGYYEALYKKYFYNRLIDKILISDRYRDENWESYELRLINLHNTFSDLDALKGLREIWNLIDLKKIDRFQSTKEVFDLTLEVVNIILDNIEKEKANDNSNDDKSNDNSNDDSEGNSNDDKSNDNSNNKDCSDDDVEDAKVDEFNDGLDKDKIKKAIEKQKEVIDNGPKKSTITKSEERDINTIGDSVDDTKVDYNGQKVDVMFVKKLTKKLIESRTLNCLSSFTRIYTKDIINEGLRMGAILHKKLQIRGEKRTTYFTRKDKGRLDKRLIAELGFGNEKVFNTKVVDEYKKSHLHMSIDASGSMSGRRWENALKSTIAIIKACDGISNIDVVVTIRTTQNSNPLVVVIYDSRIDKIGKVSRLFGNIRVAGTTPEGLCFDAIVKELFPPDLKNTYLLNMSDGMPMFSNNSKKIYYNGRSAVNHTKKIINRLQKYGVTILSYFITSRDEYNSDNYEDTIKENFKIMYGKNSEFINPTSIMDVAKTMNKTFLEK